MPRLPVPHKRVGSGVVVPLGTHPSVRFEQFKKEMREKYLAAEAPFTWRKCAMATRSTGGTRDWGDYYVSTFYVPKFIAVEPRGHRLRGRYRF